MDSQSTVEGGKVRTQSEGHDSEAEKESVVIREGGAEVASGKTVGRKQKLRGKLLTFNYEMCEHSQAMK